MKALGIVVEYNPFHNGHSYHIQESIKETGADLVIAVMSGSFLQRGEPAIVSKWSRAAMALRSGADIVFELPYDFSVQQADRFAAGAVSILEAANCETVCFGSEEGTIEPFLDAAHFMDIHREEFNSLFKEYSKEGLSYPRARGQAFHKLSEGREMLDLSRPNNILGLQYVLAALKNGFHIKPCTIQRIQADYHDTSLGSHAIASATSIRKALFENQGSLHAILKQIPEAALEELTSYFNQFGVFHHWELYWNLLKYRILSSSPDELREIREMEEGLEYRFMEHALEARSFHDFMERMKTKRYTWTRLQRASVHILTNTKKSHWPSTPEYIRLLGATEKGREYLNQNKKKFGLPLISKTSSFKEGLQKDIQVSVIYSLPLNHAAQHAFMNREYRQPVLV
ncbi:nucleotidyltransferase [Peribacillus kribbensis]|uniref:nucleotidyltransferase n=1 Tax=Peribacillus kribbensis TaxID=356658 RepID=UPI00040EFB6F|nr:nucleotidyltransferase [Peribacillus kribbensis]